MALPRPSIASSLLTLLAASVLLSGCGDDNNAPSATASSISAPSTPSENNSSGSYLFGSINVVDGGNQFTGQKISLVDPATRTLLKSVDVDTQSNQLAARAFTVSTDGLSVVAGDDKALYYTNGGKLYELGLTKPASPGNGRQVSSEAQTCVLLKVLPKDASAVTNWLLINSAGADGDCATTTDNETKLVSSDTASTAPAITLTMSARQVLDVQRDAQGKLVNILAYVTESSTTAGSGTDVTGSSRTTKLKLVAISATTGAQTDVANGNIAPVSHTDPSGSVTSAIPSVSFFGKVAGRTDQIYVRVGQDVRVLSWASGTPTLLTDVVVTLDTASSAFVHSDAQSTYVVDGNKVRVLQGLTASALSNALPGTEEVTGGVLTSSALMLVARNGDNAALHVVNKRTGNITDLSWPAGSSVRVEAVNGDTVVLSQGSTTTNDVKLLRFNAASPSTAPSQITKAEHARVITTILSATASLSGETAGTHVIWCDATTACNASNVNSYQVVSAGNLLLSSASSTSANWDDARTSQQRSTTLGLLGSSSHTGADNAPVWSTDGLWLLDAAQAGSLSQITP
ncbi:hypothetical protein [Aquabacterium sp.]|uniref:hypothetical protein n=1 Tax=Aquabacterium sp. TaxID=1872578 RepID=UPI0040378446